MNKAAIKNFAVWARRKLISEITYKAGLIGISEEGKLSPLPISTDNIEFYDIGTGKPTELSGIEVKQRQALVKKIEEKESTSDYKTAFQFVVEEVAYTWFNRLVAIRFMEVNDYLLSHVRVLSSEMSGKAEPDMVTTPFETDMEFSSYETDRIVQLKDENKLDELFRMLFIKQCNKLNEVLPELFEKTNDYTEFLLNISFTDNDGIVSHLVNDIAEDDFKEAVEIIGWLYQYYNTEPKDEVFALLKKNVKITKERIPAATQIFTPDWIVRYMTENSLGRLWLEGHPNDSLKSEWKYYLEEAEQEEEVKIELEKIRAEYKKLTPEDIKVIDPCMGSGHILVYAFDVLMQIYESQGYTQRDAAQSIIQNNIYGLDIDERAYQLAYFAIMMKARQYDRRILTREISPQLYCPKDYADGKELGSLLTVDELEAKPQIPEELTLFNMNFERDINTWNFRRILSQKYDVVITNPPYMGGSGMNVKLADYVKENYPDSKSDLSTCFMEKCLQICHPKGYMAMINIPAWMFLSSYEKLRNNILTENLISTMLHFGRGIFGSDFGSVGFVIGKNNISNYKASYRRLFERQGAVDSVEQKEKWFFEGIGEHTAQQENFSQIPGSPIAYWVSEKMLNAFINGVQLGNISLPRQGLITGDNERFLKLWYEVQKDNFSIFGKNTKWFPINKGGEARKWYGNQEYVVNWKNDGFEIKNFKDEKGKLRSRPQNLDYNFRKSISWSLVTSGGFTARYYPDKFMFNVAGICCFPSNKSIPYILALLDTKVSLTITQMLNPTINMNAGDVAKIPVIIDESKRNVVETLVEKNVTISKTDWDSFETSWDFIIHPLIAYKSGAGYADIPMEQWQYKIADIFTSWQNNAESQFNTLKANEEELNRIFIDIYGLQDELTPEVADKDVTVRKADLTRDIKSFVSYAVGCMFGRYSLDVGGLAYAGGDWDDSKYSTFIPDGDNCIPITDEEYFEDDIVGLFVAFVKKVYGAETLEENLDFIAKALGNKGNTSREIIRNYFVKDFYKDHVKTYQKRPIYWLYDSGKQDGFKALVYMHRYNADTTGLVRVDYLHKMQKTYMSEIDRMQDEIENGKTSADISRAEKRKEKLVKQLKETKEYDEKIAHLALSRIAIDLDDGVKVNYEKVQTAQDGKKLDILGKI
ncbi:MAG: BREX-1 system adenine-specific DNA-methyltransferase PglX [Lachnospiraceae bacterium]|nr:BREX-1 system adenine-specific DNA-methyltransferase PglX [Lachnospiraceae bacterium]